MMYTETFHIPIIASNATMVDYWILFCGMHPYVIGCRLHAHIHTDTHLRIYLYPRPDLYMD